MSAARQRWLDEGIRTLSEAGAEAVRIDRVAARLGLSKGSFHHHFAGAEDYKRALLDHYRQVSVDALESAIVAGGPTSGSDVLAALTELVSGSSGLYRPELDVAVRAWATWDADARAVLAEVDAARIGALQRLWRTIIDDEVVARRSALLPYLVAVGASVTQPPVDADELREVFRLLLPLVPPA